MEREVRAVGVATAPLTRAFADSTTTIPPLLDASDMGFASLSVRQSSENSWTCLRHVKRNEPAKEQQTDTVPALYVTSFIILIFYKAKIVP
ncbi:hypothetical protein BDR04DRAFT_1101204 [Suillus decipiens]|nr:hypothetical protein BDR04DRAFT_1101204 [Suillus decipiens]